MALILNTDAYLEYFTNVNRYFDSGELPGFPTPYEPAGLGTPLTQDDIDFVKKLRKEMEERFTSSL